MFQGRRNMEPEPTCPIHCPTYYSGRDPQVSPAESWRLAPFVENFRKNLLVEPASDARLKNFPWNRSRKRDY